MPGVGPRFDAVVPPGGYLWWYVDGLSECGQYGLSIISFVGSVFSPYYAWSGRREPNNHVCINVALYRPGDHKWAMTERPEKELTRNATFFQVGPSDLHWDDDTQELVLNFEELSVPRPPADFLPKKLKGRISLKPKFVTDTVFDIDDKGDHKWWPIGPSSEITVDLTPGCGPSWKGEGYLDCNWGMDPIEEIFDYWNWARGESDDGTTTIIYDVYLQNGLKQMLALNYAADGALSHFDPPKKSAIG